MRRVGHGAAMAGTARQRCLPRARRAPPLRRDSEPKSACAANKNSARPLAAAPAASVRPFQPRAFDRGPRRSPVAFLDAASVSGE